ncbi:MAG: helix-turn-helix transcriptional regulator [Labilithrix sp.]|nr:helix-turn-helix transcriptional regulator [Labilithrix sp.]MCW5810015.1 helix-turn-helix transcriptional regulator [Labilithrix sp.]
MRQLVPAPGAFICFGTEDARACADSSCVVDGVLRPVALDPSVRLTQAFGFETKSVVETTRRVYLATELYPDSERVKLPWFSAHASHGFKHALLFFLHEGGVLFGLAGLERREGEGEFTQADVEKLEALGPFVAAGARAQIAYDELSREAVALRAFSKVAGSLFVVDREKRKVIWAANRDRGIEWDADVQPIEDHIVDAAEQSLQARAKQEALPTPPRLPAGAVVAVAKVEGDPVFNNAKCAILRVEPQDKAAPIEGLSKREREIARLLVAGYSGVNVAAISGLSENTVRTYVRRLYQKLGVSNRADLVRKLMSPAESKASGSPSSVISPPPDSSLVDGDDTLD